jgi:hypothetical protein
MPRTWLLTEEESKKLLLPEEAVGGDPDEPPPERPPLPTDDQLKAILGPLLNEEFLSEGQMSQALDASVCDVFHAQVKAHALQTKQAVDDTCPPSEGGARSARSKLAGPKGAASSPKPSTARSPDKDLTLAEFHAELMPPALRARILKGAEKLHPMTQIRPLKLAAPAGCGCNKPTLAGEVIGLMGYWHTAKEAQEVNFRDVTRLNFLGGVLGERGTFVASWEGLPDGLDFTRLAQKHGTPVDLVLYARHWSHLQGKTAGERKAFVSTAVESALMLARRELQDDTALFQRRLLNPAWREADRAFDGITLMFEGGQVGTPDEGVYREFVQQFVAQLIDRMRNSDRLGWRLNLLIADDRVDVDPTYSLEWMWNTWKSTLHDPQHAEDAEHPEWARRLLQDKAVEGEHSTDIELRYLVTVREPTTRYKKELRARLDAATNLKGIKRVALLRNMRPVLLHLRGGAEGELPPERRPQLNDDLIYGSWNFNGVGLWPVPVTGLGQGTAVNGLLHDIYGAKASQRPGEDTLCDWTCPHRIGLRAALQWLLLALTVSLVAYAASCDVRRLGKPLLGAMLVMTALVVAIFAALLICDPDMEVWRARMPAITTAVAVLLFLVAAWQLLHKRAAPR